MDACVPIVTKVSIYQNRFENWVFWISINLDILILMRNTCHCADIDVTLIHQLAISNQNSDTAIQKSRPVKGLGMTAVAAMSIATNFMHRITTCPFFCALDLLKFPLNYVIIGSNRCSSDLRWNAQSNAMY